MEANKKDWEKTAQDAKGDLKTGRIPDKHTGEQYRNVSDKNRNDPAPAEGEPEQGKQQNSPSADHNSESGEKSNRASTTDSSREPKNPNDDLPTGGNVR
ncbi:hypothetical protein [uncultured Pontibacter sp.]|uniref:hypothetical protein n=1 Tax=uncultured Pontibacter sp. TaxID=453356 RepID=UPI002606F78B|nr:hypothetical protein [uncultured Pontibacter sp.]